MRAKAMNPGKRTGVSARAQGLLALLVCWRRSADLERADQADGLRGLAFLVWVFILICLPLLIVGGVFSRMTCVFGPGGARGSFPVGLFLWWAMVLGALGGLTFLGYRMYVQWKRLP